MNGLTIRVLGSGREVGRTAILVGYGDERGLLVDFGVAFDAEDKPVLPLTVPPTTISAVLVTHAHLDHVGAAPFLYVSSRPPLFTCDITAELGKLLIEDMLKLSGYYLPFEYPEVMTMYESTKTFKIGERLELGGVVIETFNAGHIPGSTMYRITVGERSVLVTGDVNTIETRLVKGADLSKLSADIVVMESTYGMYDHPERGHVEDLFIEAVKSVIEDGGVVLVPSFSLARAQEVLSLLAERLPHASVYYDGMAKEILKIFLGYREYINRYDLLAKSASLFTPVRDSRMRREACKSPGSVIVAPAGMLKGGPAQYYVKRLMDNPKNAIMLVSYQAPTTPGQRLLREGVIEEGGPRVKAKVFWFDFSSHAGASGLLELVKSVKGVEKVVLVHGSEEAAYTLGYRIREELGVDFEVPKNGDVVGV